MHRRCTLIAAAIAATITSSAFATTSTWTSTANGTWSVASNWDTNPVIPNAVDDTAIFSSNLALPGLLTVTLDNNMTIGTLSIDSRRGVQYSPSNGSLTFASSSGPACLSITTTNGTGRVVIAAPVTLASDLSITNGLPDGTTKIQTGLTISGNLSGSGALLLNGPGITVLSGNNSAWNGPITINAGTLSAGSPTSLGSGTNSVTVNPGGALSINSSLSTSQPITLAGGSLLPGIGNAMSRQFSLASPVLLTADSAITYIVPYPGTLSGTLTLDGIVSGAANLTVSVSPFIFSAANTLSGNISIPSGSLTLTSTGSFLNVPHFAVTGGALNLSTPAGSDPALNSVQPQSVLLTGGTLGLNADLAPAQFLDPASTSGAIAINTANFTAAAAGKINFNILPGGNSLRLGSSFQSSNATNSIAANVTLIPDTSSHTLRFGIPTANGGRGTLVVLPVIADISTTPTNIDIGPGSATEFDAANTYSGSTTINGILTIINPAGLGNTNGTIINAGGSLSAPDGIVLDNQTITLNGGSLHLSSNAEVHLTAPSSLFGTFNGPITGSGDITIPGNYAGGTPTTNLNGNNTFSGNVTLASGVTVNANSSTALGDTVGSTSVQYGTTLNLNAPSSETININSGTVYIYAATSGPITIGNDSGSSSRLFVNSDTSSPITLNAGNLTINHTCSSPITINGGYNPIFNAVPSGPITVNAGNVTFGSNYPTGLTTVNGGNVTFSTPGSYPINIAGGTLKLAYSSYSSPYSGNITIGGGNSTLIANATLYGNLTLDGNATLAASNSLYINSNITGAGDLFIHSTVPNPFVYFSAGLNFTGTLHAVNSTVTFSSTGAFNNAFSFEGSSVTFNNSWTFNQPLSVSAGNVNFYTSSQQFLAPFTITGGNVYFGLSNLAGGLYVSGGLASFSAFTNSTNQWFLSGGTISIPVNDTIANLTLTGGSLQVTNGATLTISSPTLTVSGGTVSGKIAGPTSLVKNSSSTTTFSNPLPASITSISIQQGTLALAGTTTLNSLTLDGSPDNWAGALDLTNGKLILNPVSDKSAALTTLQNQVANHALTSSTLPSNFAIAVLDNAITSFSTFGGQPVNANSLLVAPELLGDTNADGIVNAADLSTLLQNFGKSDPAWTSGNFSHSPTIDLTDLADLLNNFNLTNSSASSSEISTLQSPPSTPAPEPASLALLLPAALLLRKRRR